MIIPKWKLQALIRNYLEEDLPFGDISSHAIPTKAVSAEIYLKSKGVIAGLTCAEEIFSLLDCESKVLVEEGSVIKDVPAAVIAIQGEARNILQGERLALNFLGRLSGIATKTRRMQQKLNRLAENTGINPPRIAGTRKTTPGFRLLEKYAIFIGGGDPHRFSLSDCILLKDNHLKCYSTIREAIERARETSSFTHKIEVEVESLESAIEAGDSGADMLLLDNFDPLSLRKVVSEIKLKHPNIILEASGGINSANVGEYATVGVHYLSSGSLTHSVRSLDVSLQIVS